MEPVSCFGAVFSLLGFGLCIRWLFSGKKDDDGNRKLPTDEEVGSSPS